MRKMKLVLETLAVESFETAAADAAPGTVRGHGRTEPPGDSFETDAIKCPVLISAGCGGGTAFTACQQATCAASCNGTCNNATCGLTYCDDTCNICMSFITDSPQRC